MSAAVTSLRQPAPDPPQSERERVEQELQRLGVVDRRLKEAGAKIGEIDAALAALDDADRRKIEEWAAQSGASEPPSPLLDERKKLLARRLDCEAERQAAEIATSAVADRRTALVANLAQIDAQARSAAIESFAADFTRLADSYAAKIGAVRQAWLDLQALPVALVEYGRDKHFDRGDVAGATLFYRLTERLRSLPLDGLDPSEIELRSAVDRWKATIAGRLGG